MANDHLRTPDAVGPIRDPNARRVCNLNGIAIEQEKLISLRKLRDGLDMSIRELEAQRRNEEMVNKAFMVARFTKATCDAFLGVGAALAKGFLGEKTSKPIEAVEAMYGTATPLAEAASTSLSGGKADW